MKILVFEYSSIIFKDNIFSEGVNMLKSILNDLNNVDEYSVNYLINGNIVFNSFNNCNPVNIKEDLFAWLDNNINNYDCCLFIAPEDGFIQCSIAKILEKHETTIIGSNSYASCICSSKNNTYKHLSGDILKIKSIKINTNHVDYNYISNNFNTNNLLIKPDNQTSSDFIYHITSKKMLEKIINEYQQESIEDALIQEYIDGMPVSASILCNDDYINCISINSQEITKINNKINYNGCRSPIKHRLEKQIIEVSKKIIKQVDGLKGFVGIDYIIKNDDIYFVEINSRITTPYIILQKITNLNLTKTLIELILYDKKRRITLTDKGKFFKEL